MNLTILTYFSPQSSSQVNATPALLIVAVDFTVTTISLLGGITILKSSRFTVSEVLSESKIESNGIKPVVVTLVSVVLYEEAESVPLGNQARLAAVTGLYHIVTVSGAPPAAVPPTRIVTGKQV